MGNANAGEQSQLQKTFVTMIFAFVISYHAQVIMELLTVMTGNWIYFPISPLVTLNFLALSTQMLLALLMVSISWVTWSKSQAQAHLNDLQHVFTVKYFTFILEILLVTLYYGLSRSLEVDFTEYNKTKNVSDYITNVSARPEAFLMILIFGIFLIWDLVIDIFMSPINSDSSVRFKEKIKNFYQGYIVFCSVSTVCFIASIIVFYISTNETILVVIFSDLALISVLLFFYQAKVLEYYGLQKFRSQALRHNTRRVNPPTKSELARVILLAFTYIIFTVMVGICIH